MTQARNPAIPADLTSLLIGNGIDATTGNYLLPAIDPRRVERAVTGGKLADPALPELRNRTILAKQKDYFTVPGVDPNDLAQAGWAVVLPAVASSEAAARQAAILGALDPLLRHRRAAAGALYREYTGAHAYQPDETKQQFLIRLGASLGPVDPKKVPYYLLLVASPDEIPFRVQYQLDIHYAVGRIAFDTVEEYARYAQSVVDAETGRAARPRRAAFFGVANPGDAATRLSADHLVLPLVDHVAARHDAHGFSVDSFLGDAATRDRLTQLFREAPAVLFTAGHGMAFPCGHAAQRDCQGALLCQDWAGPGNPVAREHYFAGQDVPADTDLRGMIGVLFACFGGGTPTHDEFARRTLGETDARPLAPAHIVARLPQRMLGRAGGGALAAVGHIDRAWGSTFLWIDPRRKVEPRRHLDVFENLLGDLLAGKRLGLAMESFNLRYAELAADLAECIDNARLGAQYDEGELAHMWICNNDARNYAVFGDPAVRLPIAAEAGRGDPARTAGRDQAFARPVEPVPAPPEPAPRAPRHPREPHDTAEVETMPQTSEAASPAPDDDRDTALQPVAFGWLSKDDKQPSALARLGTKLGEVLTEVLADAAVLEVKTYTSDDLQAVASGQSLPTTGARLRAYTRCKLDGDTEVCVPVTSAGAVDEALWALHVEMVKQAQAHRAELLRTVLSLFSPRIGK